GRFRSEADIEGAALGGETSQRRQRSDDRRHAWSLGLLSGAVRHGKMTVLCIKKRTMRGMAMATAGIVDWSPYEMACTKCNKFGIAPRWPWASTKPVISGLAKIVVTRLRCWSIRVLRPRRLAHRMTIDP